MKILSLETSFVEPLVAHKNYFRKFLHTINFKHINYIIFEPIGGRM